MEGFNGPPKKKASPEEAPPKLNRREFLKEAAAFTAAGAVSGNEPRAEIPNAEKGVLSEQEAQEIAQEAGRLSKEVSLMAEDYRLAAEIALDNPPFATGQPGELGDSTLEIQTALANIKTTATSFNLQYDDLMKNLEQKNRQSSTIRMENLRRDFDSIESEISRLQSLGGEEYIKNLLSKEAQK